MQCCNCKKTMETKTDRVPRGWKRHNDYVYCRNCWCDKYCLRAITMPVRSPLGDDIGWPELRNALAVVWGQTTACVNWMMSQLYARDSQRMPGQKKLGKMDMCYLYPEARAMFPELPSTTVASIEQAVKGKYIKKRYEVIWTGEASLPSARYPQPFVQHNRAWKAIMLPAGKEGGDLVPCISVPLIGAQRWTIRLAGGREFRRQIVDFRRFVDGDAVPGEIAILRRRVGGNGTDHGNGVTARDGGGQRIHTRVMVKMVGWFPKTEKRIGGALILKTEPDSFLMAVDEKANKIRQWHCKHVWRWASEHTIRLQEWSDDQKCEQRPVASYQSRREAAVLKYRNRITSFQKETAAQIAGVCRRMRFASVMYDDSCREYLIKFDWSGFETILKNKLNEHNILFERVSGA